MPPERVVWASDLVTRRERALAFVGIALYAVAVLFLGMTLAWGLPIAGAFVFFTLGWMGDRVFARLPRRRELEARCRRT